MGQGAIFRGWFARAPEAVGAEILVKHQGGPQHTYRVAIVFPRAQPYSCKSFERLAGQHAIDMAVCFCSNSGAHGPQRAALETSVADEKVPRVHFAGFQNYTQVPPYYAMSDMFVLPSFREPWGCVISEAMNFALPIVASRDGGAVGDLVEDGVNRLLLDYGNVAQLAGHLKYVAANPEVRQKMWEKSAAMVMDWNFDKGVAKAPPPGSDPEGVESGGPDAGRACRD